MATQTKISEILNRDEIRTLSAPSDLAGWWAVISTWSLIALAFVLVAAWPNPLTILVALVILGGRQLALAILMHEASHYTLFRTRGLNDFAGNWLAGRFIWTDVIRYRKHHHLHHTKTGTDDDPDQSLVTPYPTTRKALVRKLLRDISGISGLRRIVGLVLMDIKVLEFTVANDVKRLPRNGRTTADYVREGIRNIVPVVVANLALAGVLALTGHLALYWLWVAAYLTTFSVFVRVRSLAEHACTEQTRDMLRNTRTTRAGWLARLTVAPLRVNYHIEHHVLPAVPYFRLRAMHALLHQRGFTPTPPGYLDVLRTVSARTESGT